MQNAMNDHIQANKLNHTDSKKYNVADYDDMVKFYRWVEAQTVEFKNTVEALKVYNGHEDAPTQAQLKTRKQSFSSRKELNSYLRRHGYTWTKVATFGEYEESQYGESTRWSLAKSSREVTVSQALSEIRS